MSGDSGVPLYRQVEERMMTRIGESGEPDSLIPTEEELAEIFGVSRITIRKAVEVLVAKGMLGRRRGVGTRILRTRMVEDLGRLRSYTEEVEGEGFKVVTKVLSVQTVVPPKDVRAALRLKRGERALRLQRVRGTNAVFPVVMLESYFPARTGMEEHDDYSRSTYALLTKKHQVPMLWAKQRITAYNASPDEAKLLRVRNGEAVLVFFRTTYSVGDQPIEFVKGVFNPKLYSFSISMQR
jgi:GntR family transcriptional regulator